MPLSASRLEIGLLAKFRTRASFPCGHRAMGGQVEILLAGVTVKTPIAGFRNY
jgi:hypothetical protein